MTPTGENAEIQLWKTRNHKARNHKASHYGTVMELVFTMGGAGRLNNCLRAT